MALFSLLQSTKSPEQKLKDAVKSGDRDELTAVLSNGVDPNLRLQKQGGNTALHFAASGGLTDSIEILISSGADCNISNDHGNPPLIDACLKNHEKAFIKLLWLTHKTDFISHPAVLRTISDYQTWVKVAPEMKLIMMKASPRVQLYGQHPDLLTLECWKTFILCGGDTNGNDTKSAFSAVVRECERANHPDNWNTDAEDTERKTQFYSWFKGFTTNPQTLQHYCRLTVRGSFTGNCNVFYGSQSLTLPKALKDYVCLL